MANPQADADAKFVEAWGQAKEAGLSARKFAKSIGQHVSALFARRRRVEARLGIKLPPLTEGGGYDEAKDAIRGWSPEHDMTHTVPEGYAVKGVSTLYDGDGKVRAQWVKSKQDAEVQRAMLEAAMFAMTADLPKLAPRKAANGYLKDILTAYPIGDPHIGMRAWREECGDDWDLAIAERVHCAAMDSLVESAPASEQALIINLGDLLHYDSMAAVTPRSGHLLDADGRYAKMVQVAVKVMRQCIESALAKHKRVHVINAPGNHDETGALWLSIALSHTYEREPRVTVDLSPAVFAYYRWGACLIGIHHGHTCKPDKLPGVMATDRAEDWGQTKYRYWYMGHIHHESKKEYPGVSVESFNTLAPKDAYTAAGGWRSRESMQAIVLHRVHGEVGRHRVTPAMFTEPAHDRTPPESSRRPGKRAAR
jgi:UDP-2,3-diacylglucosamine pyrophosphatase LpxH